MPREGLTCPAHVDVQSLTCQLLIQVHGILIIYDSCNIAPENIHTRPPHPQIPPETPLKNLFCQPEINCNNHFCLVGDFAYWIKLSDY